MCRSIKPLFNFDPPATEQEVRDAARQFVRKLTGFQHPSKANEAAFQQGIDDITTVAQTLLSALVTNAEPHNRELEAAKAQARTAKRFATS